LFGYWLARFLEIITGFVCENLQLYTSHGVFCVLIKQRCSITLFDQPLF